MNKFYLNHIAEQHEEFIGLYITALDENDFDCIFTLLEAAQTDKELDWLINEINRDYEGELSFKLAQKNLMNDFVLDETPLKPSTVSGVVGEDTNSVLPTKETLLTKWLSLNKVNHLANRLKIAANQFFSRQSHNAENKSRSRRMIAAVHEPRPEHNIASLTNSEKSKVYEATKKGIGSRLFIPIFTALCFLFLLSMIVAKVILIPPMYNASTDSVQKQQEEIQRNINRALERKPKDLKYSIQQYIKNSKDIEMILRDGLENKRVGGAIAIAVINWQYNNDKVFKLPEQLGFRRITDKDSLVEHVIKDKIVIKDIIITPLPNKKHQFNVEIQIKNLTESYLKYIIPKGQVLEIKDVHLAQYIENSRNSNAKKYPQGVGKSDESDGGKGGIIPPMEEETINFTAFCINQNLATPNGEANITIYELEDKEFDKPDRLYDLLNRRNSS